MEKKNRKPIHRVEMTDGKRQIIQSLLQEYDIRTAADIHNALKDLLGGTIKEMLEAEMSDHLGYERSERSSADNSRNGYKSKQVNTSCGSMEIKVPQDRNSSFEPRIVRKRQKDISEVEQKIIALYAKGMTTRQISDIIEDIYGFDVSESFVSDVTDKLLPQIEEWQMRPLAVCYPIVFIDAVHFSVRENGAVSKLAAYIILGINEDGRKEVLSIQIGENESAKYWLSVLNDLKNRGVADILILCADGLTGIKEAIGAAFPQTEYQRCIVHQIRNTTRYASYKDYKALSSDLKSIYLAPTEKAALSNMSAVKEKWENVYPGIMKSWERNWDSITPIFKFSLDVRKVIYTTNSIESLNSSYRRLNSQRSVFPGKPALLKALYLATVEVSKKWTSTLRNWCRIRAELNVLYGGRLLGHDR